MADRLAPAPAPVQLLAAFLLATGADCSASGGDASGGSAARDVEFAGDESGSDGSGLGDAFPDAASDVGDEVGAPDANGDGGAGHDALEDSHTPADADLADADTVALDAALDLPEDPSPLGDVGGDPDPQIDTSPDADSAVTADSAEDAAPAALDPVVFVHGYLGHGSNWDPMIDALVGMGWSRERLFAITISDTNDSIIDEAGQVARFVDDVLATTGAERVDMLGHSLGGAVTRWYITQMGGGSKVRDYISIAGAQHGNSAACLTTSFGASSRQLCPAYASEGDSVDGVQWALNGDPDSADIDETPFGVEDGGEIGWNAIAFTRDIIVIPYRVQCLDQRAREDCTSPTNRVVDWTGVDHITLIRDARIFPIVAEMLRAHGP